jgi:spermidine/putrescine transport system substrate-binding protein
VSRQEDPMQRIVRTLVAIALAAVVAGGRPAVAAESINLFGWSEYIPQTVIDDFTKETEIEVNYEMYASNEEMLAKLFSGATKYDLIQPSEYVIEALRKEDKLEKLDPAAVPNLKNIGPEYRGLPHDPQLEYSVPYLSGTVGIVVNTEKIKDPVTGYTDVFQEKYKDRIVILDDPLEIVTWALATKGLDPNQVNKTTIEEVKPVIAAWLPLVKVYDSDSPKTPLLNGDVDLGVVWSGEAALLYNENKKFSYTLPKEGAHRFIDNLAIPKGAPNKAAAEKFINYVLRPDVSVKISKEFPYTNPNVEARKLLTPEERANPASYPPGNPKLETFRDIGENAVLVDKVVTDLKAKSGS